MRLWRPLAFVPGVIAQSAGRSDILGRVLPALGPRLQVLGGAPQRLPGRRLGRSAGEFAGQRRPHDNIAVEAPPTLALERLLTKDLNSVL
jgi:hypothetical protein